MNNFVLSLVENLLIVAALLIFARWFVGFGVGAPFLPTRKRDMEDAFTLVPIGTSDVVLDLGSGDGRILEFAAERGARVIGYEINPFLVWLSRRRLKRFGDRATFYTGNFFKADLSSVTVITLFGITKLMPKVANWMTEKGHPGLKLISFAFEFPNNKPIAEKGLTKVYQFNEPQG